MSFYPPSGRFLIASLLLLLSGLLYPENDGERQGARVEFVDVASESGVDFVHESGASPEKYLMETFGSGVAWLDYNNDGFLDLYFTNGADLYEKKKSPGNRLYRNRGDGSFVDVTEQAGVSGNGGFATGVAIADYDNDGYVDIFVSYFGPNLLYRNRGDGTFEDVTDRAGLGGAAAWNSSAGFFDYDLDGHLDLYVVGYLDHTLDDNVYCGHQRDGYRMYCHPSTYDGIADTLYRNDGNGRFADVSVQAGIANPSGKGLGVTFGDFDDDGYPDIYVANDTVRNFLFKNQGDGAFRDVTYNSGVGYDSNGKPQAGMGTDSGDFDGDGDLDLFVTNFSEENNALYRNMGNMVFEEVSAESGLSFSFLSLGFGASFLDFDNDGDLDLYVTNGHVVDNIELYSPHLAYRQKDHLYENTGGRFQESSGRSGPGFGLQLAGRGIAVGDYDNDGDLDIAISNCGERAVLLRNEGGNRRHWLKLDVRREDRNHFALGATIRLRVGGKVQRRNINPVASYLSSNDTRAHFGLGDHSRAEYVEITWPSGKKQVLTDVAADQILRVTEGFDVP